MSSAPNQVLIEMPQAADPWSAAPFDATTAQTVQRLVQQLDTTQRLWLSGYLAGTVSGPAAQLATPAQTSAPAVTIVYGS